MRNKGFTKLKVSEKYYQFYQTRQKLLQTSFGMLTAKYMRLRQQTKTELMNTMNKIKSRKKMSLN